MGAFENALSEEPKHVLIDMLRDENHKLKAALALKLTGDERKIPMPVRIAAEALQTTFSEFDTPDHICPLCGQAKKQTALLELLGAAKSLELWGDDGQSWTIDVAACDGNLDKIVGLMLDVKRGTYEQP